MPGARMIRPFSWTALADEAARGGAPKVSFGKGPAYVADVMGSGGYVYLASPYSKRVKGANGRWSLGLSGRAAAEAAVEVGRLKEAGVTAISPIVNSAAVVHATMHPDRAEPAARHHPLDAEAWLEWCMPLLWQARAVVIPEIAGWDVSEGIMAEVLVAIEAGLPVIVYADGAYVADGYDGH